MTLLIGARQIWLRAWLLCGVLDALFTMAVSLLRGGTATQVWLRVATGPLGDSAADWGLPGMFAGIAVHFALMAVMIAGGLWLARHTPLSEVAPWKAGTLYGLALYCVMYGLVLPLRFGATFPDPDKLKLAIGLFPHIFLVGIPQFYLFKRMPRLT